MRLCRNALLTAALSLLASCANLLGEVPGLFYAVRLRDSAPSTVCSEFARTLASKLELSIVSHGFLPRFNGVCDAVLDASPANLDVTIVSDSQFRNLTIKVQEYRFKSPIAPTDKGRAIASQILTITKEYFPEAEITPIHLHYDLVGP